MENFLQYIKEQLIPVLQNQPTLLTLDLFAAHKTEQMLDTFLANDITISLIPGGCTSLVQPLDVSINCPFKDLLKEILKEKLDKIEAEEEDILSKGGSCDNEISVKGIESAYLVEGLREWEKEGVAMIDLEEDAVESVEVEVDEDVFYEENF
ncbi:hypothetical protein L873DRAFT_1792226 [Choiromyces venosus 120613-1]|uniref:DDE-1 domain-containing protein n=1 Tax=Choiromyces venosus 120613-1 TaxID=1336337 RepID=A0A3N4JB09_9PEZI|nr:hypothetical protein L873DRAFT_1792226 [Choiromyces venosus 120613-1]